MGRRKAKKKVSKTRAKKAKSSSRSKKSSSQPADVSQHLLKELLSLKQDVMAMKQHGSAPQSDGAKWESEERFRIIFENSAVAITVGDAEERIVSWNKHTERLLGMDKQDLHLRPIKSLYPEDEWKKMRSLEIRKQGMRESVQTKIFTKEGRLIDVDVSISVLKDQDGNINGSIGVFRDITEQKRAEQAIRASEQKFRAVFENASVAILVSDTNDCAVSWNRFTEKILGMNKEDLKSRPIHSFFTIDEWKRIRSMDIARQEDPEPFESQMVTKRGDVIDVDLSMGVLKDESGKVTGSMMIARDITERKRIESARKAKEDAESMAKTKSEFLATMSHEIRTPMNGVIGMIELLLDMDLTPEQREYIQTAKTSADSLMTLINDILDFSKIEAGKLSMDKVPFSLRDNLGDTINTLALRAHTKGLELVCHIPPHVPDSVVGDPGRLRQVIINLIGNAIKFTQEGEIVIEVDLESTEEEGVKLRFSVVDTGIGIPKDKQALIFDSFSQADNSTSRKYGGTGLGLAISAQLVHLMGGRIWVESPASALRPEKGGQGSAFRFVAEFGIEDSEDDKLMPVNVLNFKQLPVLIVDDNASNRYMLDEMLANWEMKTMTAGSGREAMGLMENLKKEGKKLAFILIDANMPMIDGFQLAAHIKKQTAFSDSKLIIMTASGMRGDAVRCRELGVAAYLTKPINQSKLLDTLLMVLATPGAGTEKADLITRHTLREKKRVLKILLVEDNAVNQLVATRMLERQGHKVRVAGNGIKALQELDADKRIDLVIMDIQMPEMDGYETTAKIRDNEKKTGKHLPIIAMTANAMKEDRQRCLDAGMDAYVPKPIRPKELFDAIAELFGGLEAIEEDKLDEKEVISDDEAQGGSGGSGGDEPGSNNNKPVLNDKEGLAHAGDDKELYKTMLEVFFEDTPARLEKIKAGLESNDGKTVECESHGIKGAAANIGAERVRDVACKIEIAAKDGHLEGLVPHYEKLSAEIEILKKQVLENDSNK